MKENVSQVRVCPKCGQLYGKPPAVSRDDNVTLICPDCGTRQALASLGVEPAEREKIISIIHASHHKKR